MSSSERTPQEKTPHERATEIVEEEGLPEDNPVADVVRELHENGESWRDIFDTIEAAQRVVDKAALEEGYEYIPEWCVVALVPDPGTPSGKRFEEFETATETAEEAEEWVRSKGYEIDSDQTEQIGTAKISRAEADS